LAGGGQEVVARAGLDQGEASGRIDEEGVDRGAARRAEGLCEDLPRLLLGNVAQHVERAVEEAVADRGDDDVADAAVIDAGHLLLRNFDGHASSSFAAALRSAWASFTP